MVRATSAASPTVVITAPASSHRSSRLGVTRSGRLFRLGATARCARQAAGELGVEIRAESPRQAAGGHDPFGIPRQSDDAVEEGAQLVRGELGAAGVQLGGG